MSSPVKIFGKPSHPSEHKHVYEIALFDNFPFVALIVKKSCTQGKA